MMEVTALKKALENKPPQPVYLVQGQEAYLIDQVKAQFRQLLAPEEATMNFGDYDLATVPLGEALNDASSAPFFGERRLVFIQHPLFLTSAAKQTNVVHDVAGLIKYLQQPSQTTTLVIFATYDKLDERKKVTKLLKKKATLIDVRPLTEQKAQRYVASYLKQKNIAIQPEALQLLVQRTEANLTLMMGELTKLILYAEKQREITVAAVESLVTQNLEQNIFTLVDAVMARDVARAVSLYRQLILQKEEPLKLNAILVGQFRLLLQVKILQRNGYSQGDLARVLHAHPYRVKLALGQAKHFSQKALRQAYLGLVDLEYQLKTSQRDAELLFQLFILKFSQNAA